MERIYFNKKNTVLLHGTDYNPEQWADRPDVLKEDARLMQLAGMNSASIGMFSWATLEPEEGKFDFSLMDETFERLHKIGAKIVLSTPSGARPRWLAEKYPEVFRVNEDGKRDPFRGRHNHCYTSPAYREKVSIINRKLAERYGNHPALALWHISNEYSDECHCPLCYAAFKEYLKKKFNNDLDLLNHEWWTTFWSHKYTSWDQIKPVDESVHGLMLEWKRFVTYQTTDFIKNEIEPIRELTPDIPVTTNLMDYWGLNYRELSKVLDVVSWDNYPRWHEKDKQLEVAEHTAFWHDYYRSVKGKPFLLMESTPSNVNWHHYNKLKRPGMHKLASLQAVAQGSDSVQYFQWRKSRGSSEKFHGAVVDHEGTEKTRVFREVAALGKTLKQISEVAGSVVDSKAAILMDTENMWALEQCHGYARYDKKYFKTIKSIHNVFWKQGISVDFVYPDSDISSYKLVVAPMLYMTSRETIAKLSDYVSGGGTLISGYITGVVNENDLCYLGGLPAENLKDVFGLWTEETDTLFPEERNAFTYDGKRYEVMDYCEVVHPSTAEVLAVYESDFYAGMPAVCKNSYGSGTAYYITCRDCGEFTNDFYAAVAEKLGIKKCAETFGEGVIAHARYAGDTEYLFLENYCDTAAEAEVSGEYIDMESAEKLSGRVTIPGFGCRVIKK